MAKDKLMALHQFGFKAHKRNIPIIPGFITRLIRLIYSFDLPSSTKVGSGTEFKHNGLGCVIHDQTIIGDNCVIYQNVSIAGREGRGVPVLGNNIEVGCGACILGGVTIGDGARIGANAVVISNIPPNCTAVGVPAKVVKQR